MDCDVVMFDLLRQAFPKVDVRIIKATTLEHGDDVKSAFSFLNSINDEDDREQENDLILNSINDDDDGEQENDSIGNSNTVIEDSSITDSEAIYVAPELSSSISQISLASLEEIVEGAKIEKEIVINLVKEVSDLRGKADQERAAALKAKREAATSGDGSLKKADELRKKIAQKKQDNFLRMGEIYGEKAVLATEAKGLKMQLEQVKLQKERAMTTLHQIKIMLECRYAEAVEERLLAEEDGRVKKKLAQDILTAEEALMTTIEEESRKLDMEADVCLQLKEFLSHHGSVIDSLQGEMCVLCEDVQSFKRQVDDGMWSSISTVSLPVNVNPEGPFTFRKCNMSSTSPSSSQVSRQSFEALGSSEHSHSRISASSSQESVGIAVERSNGSSQDYDKDFGQQLAMKEDVGWHQRLASSGSSLGISVENTLDSGSLQRSASLMYGSRDFVIGTVLTSSESFFGDHREAMRGNTMVESGSQGICSTIASSDAAVESGFQGMCSAIESSAMLKKWSSLSSSHSNRSWASSSGVGDGVYCGTYTFTEAPYAGDDGWVLTPKQMKENKSSSTSSNSSSSLVKVEADHNYLTD